MKVLFAVSVITAITSLHPSHPVKAARHPSILLKDGTLIDGTGKPPQPHMSVLLRGNKIVKIAKAGNVHRPRGTRIIDARGRFILPGLIDCHVHLGDVGVGDTVELPTQWQTPDGRRKLALIDAHLDLLAGVTTVRDMGSTEVVLKVRDDIRTGKFPGPRILAAGNQLVKQSPGANTFPMFMDFDGPEDARAKVRRQVKLGVDLIKLRLTNQRPLPSPAEVAAIVQEAHRWGRRVAVHTDVPMENAIKLVADAGVDSIEHNATLRVKDPALLAEVARKGIDVMAGAGEFWVQRWMNQESNKPLDPNTKRLLPDDLSRALIDCADTMRRRTADMKKGGWDPDQVQARFKAETKKAREAGITLVFGTDSGADLSIHGQQARALFGETQMGSTPMEALLMSTRDAAKLLGLDRELGTVQVGKLADLLVLDANPLEDMRNIGKVDMVFQGGRIVDLRGK